VAEPEAANPFRRISMMSGTTASAIGNLFKKKFLDPAMYKASKDNFFNKEKGESGENSGDDKAQIVLGVEKGLKLGSLQGKLMNATQRIKVEKMIEKARLRKFLEAKMKEEEAYSKKKFHEEFAGKRGANDIQRAMMGMRGAKEGDFFAKITSGGKGMTFGDDGVPIMFKHPKLNKELVEAS